MSEKNFAKSLSTPCDGLRRCTLVAGLVSAMLFAHSSESLAGSQDPTVIALFGDSTTTGFNSNFGDREGNGTITRGCPTIYLTNLLKNENPIELPQSCPTTIYNSPVFDGNSRKRSVVVANWGFGGTSTDIGVSRIQSNLESTKNAFEGKDYITLILYGTNDFDFGISASTTRFNLRQMVQSAKQLGYAPVLGTLTPRDDRDISPYNSAISGAASAEGVPLVDHFSRFVSQPGGWRTLIQEETSTINGEPIRLHPNDNGYLVIAETWFDQYLEDAIAPEVEITAGSLFLLLLSD